MHLPLIDLDFSIKVVFNLLSILSGLPVLYMYPSFTPK